MDPSAVNWNVTIDDFDSLLTYEDQSVWTTPDPSVSNYSTAGPWLRGTYHKTETKGASVSLNITGPTLYIYGTKGPEYGSFEVDIDSVSLKYSAYAPAADNTTQLLFGASNLTYANHNIVLRNLGAQSDAGDKGGNAFSLDFIETTFQVVPASGEADNITLEETEPSIRYTGVWGKNTGPFFSGGGSTYTNEDGASFSFDFHGSAIYVLGDKKNDHGIYTVTLDDQEPQQFDGVSGCGGAFGQTCEQQLPTLKYFASNLDVSLHTITLVNHGGNKTFFDLDSIVVVTPSISEPRQLSNDSSPFATSLPSPSAVSPTGASTPSVGTSSPGSTSAASSPIPMASNAMLLMLTIMLFYLLRPSAVGRL